MLKTLSTFFVFFLVSHFAFAGTEIPYGDAQKTFALLDENYVSDLNTHTVASAARLEQLQKDIAQLKTEQQACPDFDCASSKKRQIGLKENEVKNESTNAKIYEMEVGTKFVREGLHILVGSLSYELKTYAHQVQLSGLKLKSNSPCQSRPSAAMGAVYPSRRMICQQLNLEFKLGSKFVNASLAIGFAQDAFDHNGEKLRFNQFEIQNVRNLFSYDLAKHLDGLHPLYLFGRDPKYKTNRRPESDYASVPVGNYGRNLKWFYHIQSYTQLGYYFVKWDEI